MQSIYTAKHGLQAQQQRMDTIASNIANVSTTGYKVQSTGFKDALYTHMINPSDTASTANLQQGSGVLAATAYRDFSGGTPVETDETLDFYIEGDGFFTVQDGAGAVLYTRSGGVHGLSGGRRTIPDNSGWILRARRGRESYCAT